MSDVLGSMIQVGVLSIDIWERMMPDHMLMHPSIGCAKHEPNIHAKLVDLPVFRVCEMTCVVIYVDRPNPESDRES